MPPAPLGEVGPVDGRRPGPRADLLGTVRGVGDVPDLEHLGAAGARHHDRLHGAPPARGTPAGLRTASKKTLPRAALLRVERSRGAKPEATSALTRSAARR